MGVVIAEDVSEFYSRGYPYNKATLYVYCDHCGSFDIEVYLGLRKWLLLASPFALGAALLFVFSQAGPVRLWLPVTVLIVIVLAFRFFWGDKDYRCRRCGCTTSAQYDTLDVSSGAMTVDVPEDAVEKRYLGYWPDECDLHQWLKPPPTH